MAVVLGQTGIKWTSSKYCMSDD